MKLELLQQNIDYEKIVTGLDLDYETYNKKFEMWDYVVENNLVQKGNLEAIRLLNDITIYAYNFFKDPETDEPFKMTAYQDSIMNLKHDFTAECSNRYILFRASNQIGKSAALCLKSIQIVNNEDNKNIVMISKSLPQSQFLLQQIKFLLNNSLFAGTWKEDIGETANTTMLTIQREVKDSDGKIIKTIVNKIICAPAGEGTLGYPVHYLFLDEIDFYEDAKKFFWRVAFPRTKKTKGQIICFSNPNPEIGKSGSILWNLWDGDLFKRKFHFSFLDAPWNTREEYERDKRNSPSYIFASTHEGEWSVEGGAFFSEMEVQDMLQKDWHNSTTLPSFDRPVYIALDLGKMKDNTVMGIGTTKKSLHPDDKYKDLDVKHTEEFPLRTDYDVIAVRLKEVINHYNKYGHGVARVGFDATGQKTFGDMLKRMGVSATPVDFSKKESNKTQLFNDFKLMVENRKIKVVYSKKCEKQLSELIFKLTETKKLKVENRTDSIHDDFPDMCAILIHIAVCPSRMPVTAQFVNKRNEEAEQDKIPDQEERDKEIEQTIRRNIPSMYGNPYGEEFGGGIR